MIDKFIQEFFAFQGKKSKKGYQVIGPWRTALFFGLIIALVFASYFLSIHQEVWLLILVLIIVFWLYKTNKTIDKVLLMGIEKERVEHKGYIERYFKDKLHLNTSIQYKEMSLLLKSKGHRGTITYNLTPYLAMILTAVVTTIGLIAKEDPSSVTFLIELLISVTVVLVAANPVVNGFTNLFLNTRPKKIIQISEIVQELFIEESIKENTINYSKKIH